MMLPSRSEQHAPTTSLDSTSLAGLNLNLSCKSEKEKKKSKRDQ